MLDRRYIFAIIVVTAIIANIAAGIADSKENPEEGESEAIAKGSQNVVLGLGVLGIMMFASFVGDIFSIAKK